MNRERRQPRRRAGQRGIRCIDCEHAIFNEQWGEHKCRAKARSIPDANAYISCTDYKKKQTKK